MQQPINNNENGTFARLIMIIASERMKFFVAVFHCPSVRINLLFLIFISSAHVRLSAMRLNVIHFHFILCLSVVACVNEINVIRCENEDFLPFALVPANEHATTLTGAFCSKERRGRRSLVYSFGLFSK